MKDIDSDALNASMNSIVEAAVFLVNEGYVLLGKREDGGKRLPFDLQKQLDEGYISNFFGRGSFELKLTHEGRRYIGEGEQSAAPHETEDGKFARLAIEEARKSVPENDGRSHPMVGAVIVKNGSVLASAHRGEAKGNHAEYIALEKRLTDTAVAGATVYTTLEPCTTRNHPKIPCVERLIERKVSRVVMGMLDPDPRITGKGQRKLRSANIITDFFPHDLMAEVEELNREFTRQFEQTGVQQQAGVVESQIVDKWVNQGYEHKCGIAKPLTEDGFELGWVSADTETERVEFGGWEYVVIDEPNGKKARLKIRDHPAIGGYLVLLKRRKGRSG